MISSRFLLVSKDQPQSRILILKNMVVAAALPCSFRHNGICIIIISFLVLRFVAVAMVRDVKRAKRWMIVEPKQNVSRLAKQQQLKKVAQNPAHHHHWHWSILITIQWPCHMKHKQA